MRIAARDADILELLVRHLQQGQAAAAAVQHPVNLPHNGAEHKYEAVDEAIASP